MVTGELDNIEEEVKEEEREKQVFEGISGVI
jgi:hypothetical protein